MSEPLLSPNRYRCVLLWCESAHFISGALWLYICIFRDFIFSPFSFLVVESVFRSLFLFSSITAKYVQLIYNAV